MIEGVCGMHVGMSVGETELALQLGHRKSYGLDFVTQQFSPKMVQKIKVAVGSCQIQQLLLSDTQYTAFAEGVKITLFEDSSTLLHPLVVHEHVTLVSYEDIFSTKLFILGKRATWRDYCDIAVCLNQKK